RAKTRTARGRIPWGFTPAKQPHTCCLRLHPSRRNLRQRDSAMNRRHCLTKIVPAVVALGLLMPSLRSQAPGNAAQLTAGATYTSSDGKSAPKFPSVDVVFSLTDANGTPTQ